jgi:hypothetical protein
MVKKLTENLNILQKIVYVALVVLAALAWLDNWTDKVDANIEDIHVLHTNRLHHDMKTT